jgi:hypothetical protein
MLKISRTSFEHLAAAGRAQFAQRLQHTLSSQLSDAWSCCGSAQAPGTPPPDVALKQLLERCHALKLADWPAQAGFAALFFLALPVQRDTPADFLGWAKPLLENTALDDNERLALVLQGLAWRGARNPQAAQAHRRLAAVMEEFQ